MEQKSKLYLNFLVRPSSKDKPWENKGASYRAAVDGSEGDALTKQTMLKHLDDALMTDWGTCLLNLSSNMYGETYYAAAALVIYQAFAPTNKIKVFHQLVQGGETVFGLQQSFLHFLSPNNCVAVDQPQPTQGATVKAWPQVNEFLFPKCLMLHPKGLPALYTLLRDSFISQELRKLCQQPIQDWLKDTMKVQSGLKTVGVWIRSKASNDLGDAVNNLTQDHYQHILTILANKGIQQVVLLGDDAPYSVPASKKAAAEMVAPVEIIAKGYGFQVVNLVNYFRKEPFISWAQQAQGFGGSMACQLLVCDQLKTMFNLRCLIGKKSGGLDGPSMIGVQQIFFEIGAASASRMGFTAFIDPFWSQVPLEENRRATKTPITILEKEAYFYPWEAEAFGNLIDLAFPPQ